MLLLFYIVIDTFNISRFPTLGVIVFSWETSNARWERPVEVGRAVPPAACDNCKMCEVIPRKLMNRTHAEVSFCLARLPTAHGWFDCYLHRINRFVIHVPALWDTRQRFGGGGHCVPQARALHDVRVLPRCTGWRLVTYTTSLVACWNPYQKGWPPSLIL